MENAPEKIPSWRALSASAIGIEMALYVIGGFFAGRALDRFAGTDPLLMILFVLAGVGIGIHSMIRSSRAAWGMGPASKGGGR